MADPHRRLGLLEGFSAPWQGLAFVVRTPTVWLYALVPVLILLVLLVLFGLGSLHATRTALEVWMPPVTRGLWVWVHGLLKVLAYLLGLLLAGLLAVALTQPLSGPALDKIVDAQAAALDVPPNAFPSEGALTSSLRSLRVTVASLILSLPVLAALTLIEFVIPPAVVVTVPVKFAVSALVLSWDLLDYPFSRRALGVRARMQWFSRHIASALGFGMAIASLCLIPCAGLLFLPAGVAGATRLFIRSTESR